MKNTIKLIVAIFLLAPMVMAATLTDQALATIIAKKTLHRNDYDDNSPFSIVYLGTGTACTLTITTGTISADATADNASDFSLNIRAAGYDTWGEVYNYIKDLNGGAYTITIGDMRRAENSIYLGDVSAEDIDSITYNVLLDTGNAIANGTAGAGLFTMLAINPSATGKIRLFDVLGAASLTSVGTLRIYVEDKSDNWSETLVYSNGALTTTVDKQVEITTNDPFGGMDFDAGDRVIIRLAGDIVQVIATSGLQAYWAEVK